jgi:hypothetical protein
MGICNVRNLKYLALKTDHGVHLYFKAPLKTIKKACSKQGFKAACSLSSID